jgi:hypothetical protein
MKLVTTLIVFLLGLYFITSYKNIEGFDLNPPPRCPTVLLQKGPTFYLYNSHTARIPGVNPLQFNSLEEYVEFTQWQRSQGIICPILYLQQVYDMQGNPVYKARPSPFNMQGGLPDLAPAYNVPRPAKLIDANQDNRPPFNKNSYPGFDPENQYIGLDTPLDKMFHDMSGPRGESPNAMDSNWSSAYTKKLLDQNYYSDNLA